MKRWMEEILTMSGMNLAELRDAVEDRALWRKLTRMIARALRVDSTRWQGDMLVIKGLKYFSPDYKL